MRTLLTAVFVLFFDPANAEIVKIRWKGDYAHNNGGIYAPDNKYRSGMSQNFLNGSPEEGGKIQHEGFLTAELIKPKDSTKPVPFMILMHGCTGLTPLVAKWAQEKATIFLSQGFGVLILDSFGPRHVTKTCGAPNYHWGWRRAEDAYSALHYLIENKLTDKDQVYAMGRSNGGTAVLMMSHAKMVRDHQYRFAGIFAVSPACDGLMGSDLLLPTAIFIGDKDQANDPNVCQKLQDRNVRVVLYRGVYHGFEDRTPTYVYNGWRMEHSPKADKDSIEQTLAMVKSKDAFRPGLDIR